MSSSGIQIVTICGGLGSQMMKYSFFLELQRRNAQSDFITMIDTSPYIRHRAWNGYELKNIFGIEEDDVVNYLSSEEIDRIRDGINEPWQVALSHFSERNDVMTHMLKGKSCSFYDTKDLFAEQPKRKNAFFSKVKWGYDYLIYHNVVPGDVYKDEHLHIRGTTYFDEFNHVSDKYLLKDRARLKELFEFPEFESDKDKEIADEVLNCESVAMHIRRSDHMYDQQVLFRRHYFCKALDYIRSKSGKQLTVLVFSEDIDWCREHADDLGIHEEDRVYFVDWNKENESYRDMQLMTYCKHNILGKSTFAYWGYYLSKWDIKDKIIVAPRKYWTEVKVHM